MTDKTLADLLLAPERRRKQINCYRRLYPTGPAGVAFVQSCKFGRLSIKYIYHFLPFLLHLHYPLALLLSVSITLPFTGSSVFGGSAKTSNMIFFANETLLCALRAFYDCENCLLKV